MDQGRLTWVLALMNDTITISLHEGVTGVREEVNETRERKRPASTTR